MKFTILGVFTTAVALIGASISYAAPLNGGEPNDIQMRAQGAIAEMLSRSFDESEDMLERSYDGDELLSYTTRSFEDGGDLFIRDLPLEDSLFERSTKETLDIWARDEAPVEFSYWARSDEDDAILFGREEELLYGRDEGSSPDLVARSKIGNFFKKVFGGIKKVFLG